ncbi:MAG: asparagine synthase (glutamine-hydrolyzing) [Candidatus Omnitrophica bacterium]|nr:asparagine synthase (glutamine-hydrolyzing) [Candidatus Omnitrophota bacterium]
MCGIAGSCNFKGRKIEPQDIKRMADVLSYRGPDDEGVYTSFEKSPNTKAQAGLAHRRLSIIDLSTGHQPMSNEDGLIWIVHNGEVYNFLELKEELAARGHKFKTRSDTEVIVHLYEEMGLDCVEKLRGMFAFAIWDTKKERLFLARDRVGKKPVSYYYDGNNFIFASEIKALLQNNIPKEIDYNAINYFLTYGYIPSPRSMIKGISKLPPAHILTLDKNGIKTRRYWRLSYKKQKISFAQSKEMFKELLTEAVKLRLISDVPLGAFLSGGIDSSFVVALMSKCLSAPVKTFTIGFEEENYNEIEFARLIAKRYSTEHREFIIKPNAFELLNKLIWHYNEPLGDSSSIPTYYVAKMTREYVTVALNGDGGDESFAGYERYKGLKVSRYLQYMPKPFINLALSMFRGNKGLLDKTAALSLKWLNVRPVPRYIEALLMGLRNYSDEWRRYISWMCQFQQDQKDSLYSNDFKAALSEDVYDYILDLAQQAESESSSEKAMQVDVNSYLPEDLCVKMDIATMANSLEARSPFLDHKVMEFAASLPLNYKLHGLEQKYILKQVARDLLPKEILKRKKQGFGVPIDRWFRSELKDFTRDVLLSQESISRGYFNKEYINNILDEHISGEFNHGARIWDLLNLEIWHKTFIDQPSPQEIAV